MGMEYLSKLIQDKIQEKAWIPFAFKNKDPKISHLLFVDDIILFSKANLKSFQAIQDILNVLTNASGMEINTQKLKIWFSKSVSKQTKSSIQLLALDSLLI